jgi:cytidine deaminase
MGLCALRLRRANLLTMGELRHTDADLISRATAVIRPRRLSSTAEAGTVGCALVTANGIIHTGDCIDLACGLGFCAEHAAIATMITDGESRIATLTAVASDGTVLPPCGRCRELIWQSIRATPIPESYYRTLASRSCTNCCPITGLADS